MTWVNRKRHSAGRRKRHAARFTQENPPKKASIRLLTRSMPSGRPAPPSFSHKNTRAGRCCTRFMMTADFPAARWSGRPSKGYCVASHLRHELTFVGSETKGQNHPEPTHLKTKIAYPT